MNVVSAQQFKFARKAVHKSCNFLKHRIASSERVEPRQAQKKEERERQKDASGNCAGGVHGAFVWGHVQFRERQLVDQDKENWTVQARVFCTAQTVSSCAVLCAASGRVLWA